MIPARAKTSLETLSTVLVIVAASGLIWTTFFRERPSAANAPPPISDVTGTIEAKHLTNVEGSGSIAIIEFSDFQCPFCARHAQETVPAVKKELSGKARYIVVNLPLDSHPHSIPAAEAAECAAAQGRYWEMRDLLFEKQQNLPTADYRSYGKELGLDASRLGTCLTTGEARAKVKADRALADRLGVNGTPTLFLGRMRTDGGVDLLKRVNGAVDLQTILEEASKLL